MLEFYRSELVVTTSGTKTLGREIPPAVKILRMLQKGGMNAQVEVVYAVDCDRSDGLRLIHTGASRKRRLEG